MRKNVVSSFWHCITSFNITYFESIHFSANFHCMFFFNSIVFHFICILFSVSICWYTLGWFDFFPMANTVGVNIGYKYLDCNVEFSSYVLRSDIAGSYICFILSFFSHLQTDSHNGCINLHFTTYTKVLWEFFSLGWDKISN